MKRVDIDRYGAPEDVARCVEVADVGAPDAGEVVFDVLLFPINPADVSFCRGTYRLRPPLPATPGAECVGRIAAVGGGVTTVKPGDLVVNLQRENWAQRRRVKADDVIPVPPGMNLRQAAMLRINPPTALLLLSDFVELKPGDWIIQNVANSAVGRLVIRLGLDAVSGRATARLSAGVGDGGVIVNYGSMSGEDPVMARAGLIGGGQTLAGFILGRGLASRSLAEVRAMYADLARQVEDGFLSAPVEKIYPIEEIKTALAHAQRGERSGKILVAPNGAV